MTETWRTLVLFYPVLDAKLGSGLARRRARRVMGREERAAIESVVETLPATVAAWSEGAAILDPFDVVVVRRPIGSMSSSGGGRWWVGPREVRPELEAVTTTGATYDSVIALWPGDPDIPQCGWGCTLGPSDATFGAGFSSISTDHWRSLATDPDPAQGYVHEWLHQVEAVYRALGLDGSDLPPLHDAGAFGSTRPADEPPYGRTFAAHHDGIDGRPGARTWSPWYRDWMTGRLRPMPTDAANVATGGAGVATDAARATTDAASVATGAAGMTTDGASWLVNAPIGLTPDRWALRGRADRTGILGA